MYTEVVERYVVEYLEEYTDQEQAQFRLNGINPDEYWQMIWSFVSKQDADVQCKKEKDFYLDFCDKNGYKPKKVFRVRDISTPLVYKTMAYL